MTHKYKIGQRCVLLPTPNLAPQYRGYVGAFVTIVKLAGYSPRSGQPGYYVDKPALRRNGTQTNFNLRVVERCLRPIDDKPEAGDWETITKLLGTDIRKESTHAH